MAVHLTAALLQSQVFELGPEGRTLVPLQMLNQSVTIARDLVVNFVYLVDFLLVFLSYRQHVLCH